MDDKSSDVADDLERASCQHTRHEPPCPHLDTLKGVDGHGQAKYGDEDGVGGDVGLISQDARLEWACVESAIGVRAKCDQPVWKRRH